MDIESLKIISKNLPSNPGVYQFFDSKNNIIYIGKAKNLKARTKHYTKIENLSYRHTRMISETENFDIAIELYLEFHD